MKQITGGATAAKGFQAAVPRQTEVNRESSLQTLVE